MWRAALEDQPPAVGVNPATLRRPADADTVGISPGPARKPFTTVPSPGRGKRPALSDTAHNH